MEAPPGRHGDGSGARGGEGLMHWAACLHVQPLRYTLGCSPATSPPHPPPAETQCRAGGAGTVKGAGGTVRGDGDSSFRLGCLCWAQPFCSWKILSSNRLSNHKFLLQREEGRERGDNGRGGKRRGRHGCNRQTTSSCFRGKKGGRGGTTAGREREGRHGCNRQTTSSCFRGKKGGRGGTTAGRERDEGDMDATVPFSPSSGGGGCI